MMICDFDLNQFLNDFSLTLKIVNHSERLLGYVCVHARCHVCRVLCNSCQPV